MVVVWFNLRITEKSRLEIAAAAIRPRITTRKSAREFCPLTLGERRESTSDDIVADWHGGRRWRKVVHKVKIELGCHDSFS